MPKKRLGAEQINGAYDAAWQHLWPNRLSLTADQVPVLKKKSAAGHSGIRLQREARRRATERDCIARGLRAQPRFRRPSLLAAFYRKALALRASPKRARDTPIRVRRYLGNVGVL